MSKFYTLGELFEQDEAERLAKSRAEIAREKAEWDAKPQEEKDRIIAENEERWERFDEAVKASEAAADEDEDEDDEPEM